MYRLEEIGFLTVDDWQAFGADKTSWEANGMQGPFPDCAISKIIKRYQAAIGLKVPDEFIAPGKFTEKALLEGKGGNKKEEPAHPLSPSTQTGNALPPNTPDYECIAKELYEAGQGWGTDEKKIFKNLALIEAGGDQAKKLKETFCKLYDKDLEQFLKDELWDWGWFNEESKALGMLDGKGEEKDAVEEKDETSDIKAPELGGGATWVIKPLISQESFISQAPPSLASGVTTLTLDQLFSYDLKSYGPGQSRDIKKSENWPKHTSWNSKEPWTTYDQALTATHWLGCHNAAIYMAQKAGVKGINNNADWNTKMDESKAKGSTGGAYIDSQLKAGSVVVARVKVTTMHSVLITGKGKDDKGSFFTFLDPGRSHAAGYNYDLNRLYISKEKIKGGDPAYNSYTLMQVRESIK
ncbi:MAG: hypothetical protein H6581_22640 [Bacteroidia bacterium]|nr:hypothetical protein [Bacteroidia bacterium]